MTTLAIKSAKPDNIKLLASIVPAVNVTVLVDPKVILSCNCQVPPTPSKVNGKSRVTPLVVIVFVPDVAANVKNYVVAREQNSLVAIQNIENGRVLSFLFFYTS